MFVSNLQDESFLAPGFSRVGEVLVLIEVNMRATEADTWTGGDLEQEAVEPAPMGRAQPG